MSHVQHVLRVRQPHSEKTMISCSICDDTKTVSVPWPSGYPHAAPCPACCPDQPCGCDAPNCPTPAAIEAWFASLKPAAERTCGVLPTIFPEPIEDEAQRFQETTEDAANNEGTHARRNRKPLRR